MSANARLTLLLGFISIGVLTTGFGEYVIFKEVHTAGPKVTEVVQTVPSPTPEITATPSATVKPVLKVVK